MTSTIPAQTTIIAGEQRDQGEDQGARSRLSLGRRSAELADSLLDPLDEGVDDLGLQLFPELPPRLDRGMDILALDHQRSSLGRFPLAKPGRG